jgi:hypothetical protein
MNPIVLDLYVHSCMAAVKLVQKFLARLHGLLELGVRQLKPLPGCQGMRRSYNILDLNAVSDKLSEE